MIKLEAKKDGNGNIVISEDSFEMILACLDNQKFVHELPQNGDSLAIGEEEYKSTQQSIQETIDEYNRAARKVLHQKYIFETVGDGYWLTKRYDHQDSLTPWSGDDREKVCELFKDTIIIWDDKTENLKPIPEGTPIMEGSNPIGMNEDGWIVCKREPEPWLIERPMRYEDEYLTISENGTENRPWKLEEIEMIKKQFSK